MIVTVTTAQYDLKKRLTKAIKELKSSVEIFYDADEFVSFLEKKQYPCVGLFYLGKSPSVSGRTHDLSFDLVLTIKEKKDSRNNRDKLDMAAMLDKVYAAVSEDLGTGEPTDKSLTWEFSREFPFGLGGDLEAIAYVQSWVVNSDI